MFFSLRQTDVWGVRLHRGQRVCYSGGCHGDEGGHVSGRSVQETPPSELQVALVTQENSSRTFQRCVEDTWPSSSAPLPTIQMKARSVSHLTLGQRGLKHLLIFEHVREVNKLKLFHKTATVIMLSIELLTGIGCFTAFVLKERERKGDDLCACFFTAMPTRSFKRILEVMLLKGYMKSTVLQWCELIKPPTDQKI